MWKLFQEPMLSDTDVPAAGLKLVEEHRYPGMQTAVFAFPSQSRADLSR